MGRKVRILVVQVVAVQVRDVQASAAAATPASVAVALEDRRLVRVRQRWP